MATEDELLEARRTNAAALRAAGRAPYPNDFRATDEDRASRAKVVAIAADEARRKSLPQEDQLTGDEPFEALYGRVVAKRGPFLVIQTPDGRAQAYIPNKGEALSPEERAQLEALDLADHVLVRGPLMGTKKGDAAVHVRSYLHLGKALMPPPGKFHGLKDVEKRYRERYVDLFANPEVADVFVARALSLRAIRHFLDERDFLEVETPLLQSMRGGATAKPFTTHHNALDIPLYLRVAPELYLKRCVVGGFDRVYEIGRNFRNEGVSTRHNPEFTMLEFYLAYATCDDQIAITEALIKAADAAIQARFGDRWAKERTVTLGEPFERLSMEDAILRRLAGGADMKPTAFDGLLDAATLKDANRLAAACETASSRLGDGPRELLGRCRTRGERIYTLFELLAEPSLEAMVRSADGTKSRPVFITGFPKEVSPLARVRDDEPELADRFELFVEGRELANGFSELNDPDDQAARFRAQLDNRARGDEEAMDFDEDYIRALMHGMPHAAGCGIGIDRLVMTLCNQTSIRDVLLFPLMRPEGA
ncbi:MAG: lysine--tRNA ligase [Sandaracinaceae bacterium]